MNNVISFPTAAERALLSDDAAYAAALTLVAYDRPLAIEGMLRLALHGKTAAGRDAARFWLRGECGLTIAAA